MNTTSNHEAIEIASKLSTGRFSHIESPLVLDIVTETLVLTSPRHTPEGAVERNYWQSVFKNAGCFEEWAKRDSFWEQQPYGTRFYFGEGTMDYINRGVLESAVEELNRAKAAIAALPAEGMQGWRPIAEAPKDGTQVLLAVAGYPDNMVVAGFDKKQGRWIYDEDYDNYFNNPTHFMLLPAPPAKGEA